MKDFNEIFELENSFNEKNDIILSFYKNHINSDDEESNDIENSYKSSFNRYMMFNDYINSKLSDASDIVQTMSLLIEREQYINHILITNELNK